MLARLRNLVLGLPFLIGFGIFTAYLLGGFFLVDPLARQLLPWIGEKKLASRLHADEVRFNPFTLEATITGLRLERMNGQPLAGFDRLYVDVDSFGAFRRAWRMRDIQLEGPRAHVEVQRGGRLNWADLIERLKEDKEPPSDTIARVLVDHIEISRGNVSYVDANRTGEPFRVLLQPLGIALDGLSTLPEDRGNYLIAARLPEQGGTLKWKGDVALNPVQSTGEISLEGVQLGNLLRVIKTPRNFDLAGILGAGARYRFALVRDPRGGDFPDQPWLRVEGANLSMRNLQLTPLAGGAPVMRMAEARMDDASFDLTARRVGVNALSLKGINLAVRKLPDGQLDWQQLFATATDKPTDQPVKAAGKPVQAVTVLQKTAQSPWHVAVGRFSVAETTASFMDETYLTPLRVEMDRFDLQAKAEASLGETLQARVDGINAQMKGTRLLSGTQRVAQLENANLNQASFDLAQNHLEIAAIGLSGLASGVVLDKDKKLNWSHILTRRESSKHVQQATAMAEKPALALNLKHFSLDGVRLVVRDESTLTPVNLNLQNGRIAMQGVSLELHKPVAIQGGLDVQQGGKLRVQGALVPGKPGGRLDVQLSELALKSFAPYVSRFAKLDLQSGALSSAGKLEFSADKPDLALHYDGGFALDNLAIIEEETSEAFLGWKKLSSDSLDFQLRPNKLHINELVAVNPFGKVIIFEDKTLNLKRIQRNQNNAPEVATEAQPGQAERDIFPLAIERLRIDGANAEFADLSLTPQFGTRMHDLSGVVTGLSSDPATMALVELDGKVDDYGSARVRGSIQPFRATDFTDLRLTFRNLEMANLTPYSGKFAGRRIDSGKLSVDLEYKIKQRQLAGENKFVINKLRLGERVDSKDAMSLPLDLAIAILEDSDGVIDLDLPVSGSLDDPQFSYGKVVWKAIVNVLTKIVTAPFRAIGGLLGISADKLEVVEFDFGESGLAPPEREKLKNIGMALSKRPALTLTISPAYETRGDTRAIQEMWIRRDVANQMGLKIEPGKEPGPVDVTNPRAQKALETLYGSRFAKQGGLKPLLSEYEKPREGVRPVHLEMLERLTLQIPVTEAELHRLALGRAEAMRDELAQAGKIDPARISIGKTGTQGSGGKVVVCKMSLGAARRPEK